MNDTVKNFDDREVHLRTCEIMKSERLWRDLTQIEMANRLGISQSALSKIEKAKMLPTLIPWLRFCVVFELPCDLPVNSKLFKTWSKRTQSKKKELIN